MLFLLLDVFDFVVFVGGNNGEVVVMLLVILKDFNSDSFDLDMV